MQARSPRITRSIPRASSRGNLPSRRSAAPDPSVEKDVLRRRLPDHAQECRVVRALVLRALAIDLADESELRMHRQLADNPPDGERVSVVSIETAATVDVHRDRRDLSADNTDRLESDAMLMRKGRRQQRPGFDRNADAFFFLEHAFLEHAFQEQPRIGDLEAGAALDTEPGDRVPVLRDRKST